MQEYNVAEVLQGLAIGLPIGVIASNALSYYVASKLKNELPSNYAETLREFPFWKRELIGHGIQLALRK